MFTHRALVFLVYRWFQGEPEIVGTEYKIEARHLTKRGHEDILDMLSDDSFVFKSEYLAALRYLDLLKERQSTTALAAVSGLFKNECLFHGSKPIRPQRMGPNP